MYGESQLNKKKPVMKAKTRRKTYWRMVFICVHQLMVGNEEEDEGVVSRLSRSSCM